MSESRYFSRKVLFPCYLSLNLKTHIPINVLFLYNTSILLQIKGQSVLIINIKTGIMGSDTSQIIREDPQQKMMMMRMHQASSRQQAELTNTLIGLLAKDNRSPQLQSQIQSLESQKLQMQKESKDREEKFITMQATLNQKALDMDAKIKELQSQHPKLVKEIDELRKKNEEINKKINNPQQLQNIREEQLQNYLKFLSTKKWDEDLTNQFGIKNNVVVGNISTGKSSLLNYYFNLDLQVGISEVTAEATPVRKGKGKATIWDSPGVNEDFDLTNVGILKMFGSANKIFVLFNTSLRSSKNQVRILATLKPKDTYCIRTMCDKFKTNEELEKTLAKDREILKKWDLNIPVFGVSAFQDMPGNKAVKELLDT